MPNLLLDELPQTLAAAKMSLTDWDISGPIPSPSMSVTVYFPYVSDTVSEQAVMGFPQSNIYFLNGRIAGIIHLILSSP